MSSHDTDPRTAETGRHSLTRRRFLRVVGLTGSAAAFGLVAACAPTPPANPTSAPAAAKPTEAPKPAEAKPAAVVPTSAIPPATSSPAPAPKPAAQTSSKDTLTIAYCCIQSTLDPHFTPVAFVK